MSCRGVKENVGERYCFIFNRLCQRRRRRWRRRALQFDPKRRALAFAIGCIKPHETWCVTLHNEWANFVSSQFGCAKPTTKVRITLVRVQVRKSSCMRLGNEILALCTGTTIHQFILCVKVGEACAKTKRSVAFCAQVNSPLIAVVAVAP